MALESGGDLAHYHVLGKIGEGGMGEVYRATDRKLGRDVAIKLLPPELSGDPERLARFQREAQVLASLNHPNVAAIYGIEEVDARRFLVLELVEGPDLAERLAHGPLPLDQALAIARQIADALETAHERGIVHRDLKPANVKLTADGKVKILDFGLAKALLTGSGGEADPSLSPTITSLATRDGVILGTAAYMSPEQARGSEVDRRADIWSFGCVLLEMLTGGNPFREATVSDTLASILRSEPEWERLPADVPSSVRHLLRRCLEKDPLRRLRDIGEARIAIDAILSGEAAEASIPAATPAPSRRAVWIAAAAAVVVTAVATLAVVRSLAPSSPKPMVRRFEAIRGTFDYSQSAPPAISPDGSRIVFSRDGSLWVRRLDQLEPRRIDGTEGATEPAWTADSSSIVFAARGEIRSISAAGGSAATLAFGVGDVTRGGGIACAPDGLVAYATGGEGISEIPTRGGESRDLLLPDSTTESDFHQPSFLPDGSLLFVVHRSVEGPDTIAVLADGKHRAVLQLDSQHLSNPVYSPTGHILFRRGGPKAGLWAVPFSLERREATGEPFLVTVDGSYPSVSSDGTLVYVRGAAGGLRQLVWVDRDGKALKPVGPEQAGIAAPSLSPDGSRVVVMAQGDDVGNIWVYDILRGTRTRLTFNSTMTDWDPIWTPDGREIVYWDGKTRALSRKTADGSGETVRILKRDFLDSGVPSLSVDGRWMAFWAKPSAQSQDVWIVDLEGDSEPRPLLDSTFVEDAPRISPDGNFLLYTSDESGRSEVYMTRFPSGKGKWQVSADGGITPVWSRAGGEMFYLEGTRVKQVDVTLEPSPRLGTPRTLFDATEAGLDVSGYTRYDVSSDGRRLLMVRDVGAAGAAPGIVVNYDWTAAFRETE